MIRLLLPLFIGDIGIKTEIKTKAAKLRRQRDSYEREKMRIDQSERNLTFKKGERIR